MNPYPPFPPDVELLLLFSLSGEDFDSAIQAMRIWEPGWGEADRSSGQFGLGVDEKMLRLILQANPPQILTLDKITRKHLRIMALMIQFAGGENGSRCDRWAPGAVEWESWKDPVRLARMCAFWAKQRVEMDEALRLGKRQKRVLGDRPKPRDRYARCSYCQAVRERGFIPIEEEFEPGILFPPFSGCEHVEYSCRCMLEFA